MGESGWGRAEGEQSEWGEGTGRDLEGLVGEGGVWAEVDRAEYRGDGEEGVGEDEGGSVGGTPERARAALTNGRRRMMRTMSTSSQVCHIA